MGREGAAFRQRRSSDHHLWKCHPPLCHPERSRGICGAPRLPHKGLRSVSSPTESSSRLSRPAVEPEQSVAEGPAVSFYPSDLTAPDRSHRPPPCHPERSRGICGAPRLPHKVLHSVSSPTESSSCLPRLAVGPEQSVVEGPAVSLLLLPQNRHPESL